MEEKKLTLEERIARTARSQAISPETAAQLVERFARMHTVLIFHGSADLELMYGLIGPYMDQLEDDLLHYAGFCHSINAAFADNDTLAEAAPTVRPAMGTQASNAVVLLGLMLLDHAKGRGRDKEVYHCTRMTVGQYLDALETVAFPEEEGARLRFRDWRDSFLHFYPDSTPLADTLGDMLRLYIHGWKRLDSLDHILRCMEDLSRYLERGKTEALDRELREVMRQHIAEMDLTDVEVVEEEDGLEEEALEQHLDPVEYYFDLALSYSWEAMDPAGEEIKAREVREQIFLSDRDYSPQAVAQLVEQAPAPEFQALLERYISERWLVSGMSKVNQAISNLFMMCVGPYLWMKKAPQ